MFLVFYMNIKNIDPEPPHTTVGHQQPATAPPLRPSHHLAPATAHGGRSHQKTSLFFSEILFLNHGSPTLNQEISLGSDGSDDDTWQRRAVDLSTRGTGDEGSIFWAGRLLGRWIRFDPTAEMMPRGKRR
ncbi:hypothetical protein GQ457_05G016210 [Hibiscus cannabinus]